MNFDEAAGTIHNIFGNRARYAVKTQLDTAAQAWQTYEQGMDWDPNYLVSMGTLDMDTEEFAAVLEAAQNLGRTLESGSTAEDDLKSAAKAQAFLDALEAYRSLDWDESDIAHEQLAHAISNALEVPFAGRHGGGSSNNPC